MTCACGRPVWIKKWGQCRACYQYHYKRRTGRVVGRKKSPRRIRPGHRPLLKVTDLHRPITYYSAHRRVLKYRGPARAHNCIDCGGQATQWSYRGGSRHELSGTALSGWTGQVIQVTWSTEVADYDPRCTRCHIRFDRWLLTSDTSVRVELEA